MTELLLPWASAAGTPTHRSARVHLHSPFPLSAPRPDILCRIPRDSGPHPLPSHAEAPGMCDSVWRGSRSHPQACWGAGRRPAAQGVGRSAPSREPEEGNRQSQAAPAPGHQRHRPTTLAGGGGLGWNARRSLGTFSCVPHPPRAGEPEAQEGLPLLCPLVLDPSGSQAGGSLPRRHFPEMVPALLHISGKATPALWVRKPALGWLIVGISGPGVRTCSGRVPELMAGPTPLWGTPLLNSHFRGCWGPRAESVTDRGLGQGLG